MQVGSIKAVSKAPGTKRLKLNYDELLSSFAFKFNVRRYKLASFCVVHRGAICAPVDDIIPLIEYLLTEHAMFARLAHGAALHGRATQFFFFFC